MSNGDSKDPKDEPPTTGKLAFILVIIMLSLLFLLTMALIAFVWWHTPAGSPAEDKIYAAVVEYSKWAFTSLVGAFGAWIGAGAAYFFGKENLAESSRSTAEALRIQQEALRSSKKIERVGDLPLTAMNGEFSFNEKQTKQDVTNQLTKYVDYWWVPVLDSQGRGTLKDVIHASVFWNPAFSDSGSISEIIKAVDADPNLKKLHGDSFFTMVGLDDRIQDVNAAMNKSGAAVGIVVDGKGLPTYCFTKQNLLSANK